MAGKGRSKLHPAPSPRPKTLKTARQDALERKTVFRQVTDNPLTVQWPSLPQHLRSQVLDLLCEWLQDGGDSKGKKTKQPVSKPAIFDHLVIGINAVTKALEPPSMEPREPQIDGRTRQRQYKIESLRAQVERDDKNTPRLVKTLRRTGIQPAVAPAGGSSVEESVSETKGRARYAIVKRRVMRRRACRELFMIRQRKYQLAALEQNLQMRSQDVEMKSEEEKRSPLAAIVVCRLDIDPPSLISHLPLTLAAYNARRKHELLATERVQIGDGQPTNHTAALIQLNAGAEAILCRALHIRRAAVVGIRASCPELSRLWMLLADQSQLFVAAHWLESRGFGVHAATAIRHLRTTAPIDLKAHRKAHKLDRAMMRSPSGSRRKIAKSKDSKSMRGNVAAKVRATSKAYAGTKTKGKAKPKADPASVKPGSF